MTYGELYAVQPFGNTLTVLTMTGEMLRRLLDERCRGFTYRVTC